jgi:hypothetical protein
MHSNLAAILNADKCAAANTLEFESSHKEEDPQIPLPFVIIDRGALALRLMMDERDRVEHLSLERGGRLDPVGTQSSRRESTYLLSRRGTWDPQG